MQDNEEAEARRPPPATNRAEPNNACAEIDAEKLMKGGRETIIIHNGERYRLRITSKQKLILTK